VEIIGLYLYILCSKTMLLLDILKHAIDVNAASINNIIPEP
jgi:hypothetical protein